MLNFKKIIFIFSILVLSSIPYIFSMEQTVLKEDKKNTEVSSSREKHIESLLRKIDIAIKEENIPQMEKYLLQLKSHVTVATIYSQLIKEKQRILSETLEKLKNKKEEK